MLGTIVNMLAVLIGGTIGLLFRKKIPQKIIQTVMIGLALCTIYVGISGCLKGQNALITILSVALGAVIGELIDIDHRVNQFGGWLEKRFSGAKNTAEANPDAPKATLAEGFVTSSLVFCVGAMAILGSLQSGLTGDNSTLYTKSLLDFMSSIVFAASLGSGVLFSIGFIFVYQGGIALLAQVISPLLGDAVIAEMTCAGSILIIGLGLNLLKLTKIKIMNFLPAIFLPMALCPLWNLLTEVCSRFSL